MIREKTVCFSGHRPHKLITGGASPEKVLPVIQSMLYFEITEAIKDGYENFISGMAAGVDLWAARFVLALKNKHPHIKLICAVPYEGQSNNLRGEDLFEYTTIINAASEVITLSESYHRDCFRKRNQFMVDNSSRLIAVVSNYHSGTGQTINYARKNSLDLHIIDAAKCCETQLAAERDKK